FHRMRDARTLVQTDPALRRHGVPTGAIDEQPEDPAGRLADVLELDELEALRAHERGDQRLGGGDDVLSGGALAPGGPQTKKAGTGAHFSRACFEKCRRGPYHAGPRRRKANAGDPAAEPPGLRADSRGGAASRGSDFQRRLRTGDDPGNVGVHALLGRRTLGLLPLPLLALLGLLPLLLLPGELFQALGGSRCGDDEPPENEEI